MAQLLVATGLFATKAAASAAITNTLISVGLGLVQRALTPDQVIKQQGPRLANSQITGASEGNPINRVAGGFIRVGGQLIWATKFKETIVESSESSGGKGGGGKVTTVTTEYIYSCSFAVALCESNAEVFLSKIWFDGKRVDLSKVNYRFYDGSQLYADWTIEAAEGVGKVPAFNGVAYILFEDLVLTDYGNRIPQVSVELGTATQTLSQIIWTLARRVGYEPHQIDISKISFEEIYVPGMLIGSITSPRAVLENLQSIYLFDSIEEGEVLKFFYRKSETLKSVDLDDMIIKEQGDGVYVRSRKQDEELPDRVQVDFLDPHREYNPASVDGHNVTGHSRRVVAFSSIAAIETSYAKALADILTYEQWIARDTIRFTLPFGSTVSGNEYLSLSPGMVFDIEGWKYRVARRVIGDEIEIEGVGYASEIYVPVSHINTSQFANTLVTFGSSLVVFADLPLVSQSEPALYSPRVIVYQEPFPAAVSIFQDDGAGGVFLNTNVPILGVYGVTTTPLDYGKPWVWDTENSVTINIYNSNYSLSSTTDEAVLNGANALAIRTVTGEWEVFQFANAVLNGDGTFTVSRLLRGQLGTEVHIGNSTPIGSWVILYNSNRWGVLSGGIGNIGQDLNLRYGPAGVAISDSRYQDATVTPRGVPFRPYAPTQLRQVEETNGDLTFSWVRRTRFDGDSWETEDAPLNEEYERYRVTIYNGSTAIRTWDVNDQTSAVYSEANQITDFGSSQSSVTWTVQQVSAIYGAGSIANG